MNDERSSPAPTFQILLIVSASVHHPDQDRPEDYLVYEHAGRAESAPLLLSDLQSLGAPETMEAVRAAVARFYREDLKIGIPYDVTHTLRFEAPDKKGCYMAFARNCGCPVAVWEEDLDPTLLARLLAEHIQQGLIIQHVPGCFVSALSSKGLRCPHNQGNPGLWDQPIETETASLAALQIEHGDHSIQLQGNHLGLMALIEALQRALAEGDAELKTFDEAGSTVRLAIHHANL